MRSSRTSAWSGFDASASAGTITGNTCASTLPIRVAGSTSRRSTSYDCDVDANPSPASSSSVAGRSTPGLGATGPANASSSGR